MTLKRFPDWRERLARMLESAQQLSFEWGLFDCALHTANCIKAITGVDPAESYRRTYSDAAGAAGIFGDSFEEFLASSFAALGMPEIGVTFARRGDAVFVDNDTDQGAVGVVSLDARYVSCVTTKGSVLISIDRWKRAWRVG